jgi:hypothetical protein
VKLSYSALFAPREGSSYDEYEDAFCASADSSVVAVSDGAGTAFESRKWARLLTREFVKRAPFGLSREGILDWADEVASEWSASIPWEHLNYYQQERASEGSSATLVGLRLEERKPGEGTWQCIAIGDSCLFQVTGENLSTAWPVTRSGEFTNYPPLLYTRRENTDIGQLAGKPGTWRPGDRFFLLTDAIAEWFLREAEQGRKPWDTLASLDQESFPSFVSDGRRRDLLHNDDVTVVILETALSAIEKPVPEPLELPAAGTGVVVLAGAAARKGPAVPPAPDSGPTRPLQPRPPEPPRVPVPSARRVAVIVVVLVVGLLAGIAIGRATSSNGSSTTPRPKPPVPQTAAIETAARDFAQVLVTSHGNLADYESAMRGYVTPALDNSLAQVLRLNSPAFGSVDSQGQVKSIALAGSTDSAADVYATVDQIVTVGNKLQSRYLLIHMEMSRLGGKWLVSRITLIPAADQLIPPQTHHNAISGGSS